MTRYKLLIVLLAIALPATLTAERKITLRPPLRIDHDHAPIAQPKNRNVSETFAILYNSWTRHLNLEYDLSKAADIGALNVNAWDEVPDSSWFTNRIGLMPLSFDDIEKGIEAEGKDPEPGTWIVTKIGDEGYTPKIYITDSANRRYVLKFDLPAALERNSAAERICTLILHAVGFNVPHNSIAFFRREQLRLGEDATYTNSVGQKQPLIYPVFESMMQKLKPMADGRYRGLASFLISGASVGRFVYQGKRKDDPNDLIPHELRRELRGLRIIASWINHVDVGDKNAGDFFIAGEDKRGYVRHYLLDFGSALGSGDFINGPYRVGHEYIFDGSAIGKSFVTLGAWRRPWDVEGRIVYPEVGYFQAELFDSAKWKPNYPNLAFVQMDDADGYWGAKIVTAFTDDMILRLVQAGNYTRPEVTQYVAEVLKKRRDAIGRYWLSRVTPLDEFSLTRSASGYRLSFRDLAVERGYKRQEGRSYRYWIDTAAGKRPAAIQNTELASDHLDFPAGLLSGTAKNDGKPDRYGRVTIACLFIQAMDHGSAQGLPVEVILGHTGGSAELAVLGYNHATRQ